MDGVAALEAIVETVEVLGHKNINLLTLILFNA